MPTSTAPVAGQLRNFDQLLVDNTGGVEALWYCDVADVLSVPNPDEAAITADVVLRTGAAWYQVLATRGTLRYSQAGKTDRHGDFWQPQLKGALAKASPAVAAGLEALEGRRFLLIYRDQNGHCWLVGTPDSPLTFTEKFDSGTPTERNGYDFQFAGETDRRARPYLGTWEVSEVGLQTGVVLQPGGGGTVTVRDRAGNLMATAHPGQSIIVTSAFLVTLSVQP